MSRLRLLLFWLLVLAIPVQGFAATSRLLCDSAGGAHHHETVGPQAGEIFHSHDLQAVAQVAAQSLADPGVSVSSVDNPAHQCGLCAACCHAVAIAHQYQLVFASPVPQADIPDIAAHIPSRGLRLPEKPPRV